jgi:hypothetical protein
VAEARQKKAGYGSWRIYESASHQRSVRDPISGAVAIFEDLELARRWWRRLHPGDPPLREALKCVRCGGYFGPLAGSTVYEGNLYHIVHAPQVASIHEAHASMLPRSKS